MDVEELGPCRLYPPVPEAGKPEWSMSYLGHWLPVLLADRDACLIVAGLVVAGTGETQLLKLRDKYNRADPPQSITTGHLFTELAPSW